MKTKAFNTEIDKGYYMYPKIKNVDAKEMVAELFEQIMLFDQVVLKTGRINFALQFLIQALGIPMVERLVDANYIKFLLYSPNVMRTVGRKKPDGSIDESAIIGKEPLVAGSFDIGKGDIITQNIESGLAPFDLQKKHKKLLIKKIRKNYIPTSKPIESSKNAIEIIYEAYNENILAPMGLPYAKELINLNSNERNLLHELGDSVLETILISDNSLISFNNNNHYRLYQESLDNIGKALTIKDNAYKVFEVRNIPNLKRLFLDERMTFDQALKLRHKSYSKFFRKWLNEIAETHDAKGLTKEYLDELMDKPTFFDTSKGKFLRTISAPVIGTAISTVTNVPMIPSLGLALFNTFIFQNILDGRKPKTFLEKVKMKIREKG